MGRGPPALGQPKGAPVNRRPRVSNAPHPTRRPQRAHRVLWCLWFAAIMGAPYAPLSQDGYQYAYGPSSLSNLFAWTALGVAAGLWLGTHPSVAHALRSRARLRHALGATGAIVSAMLVTCTWANAALLLAMPSGFARWDMVRLVGASPLIYVAQAAVAAVLPHAVVFALVGALLCGLCLPQLTTSPSTPPTSPRAACCIACALGLLQSLAWMYLLPHSAFPQPSLAALPSVVGELWTAATPATIPLACIPTALMLAFSLAATAGAGTHRTAVGAMCLGVLGFRMLIRVVPDLCLASAPVAAGALALYGVGLAAYFVLAHRPVPPPHVVPRDAAPSEHPVAKTVRPLPTARELHATLTPRGHALLADRVLTDKETLVVCAHIQGLTATQVSAILHISESTVREYRRRARTKCGVDDLDAIVQALPPDAVGAPPSSNPAAEKPTDVSASAPRTTREDLRSRIGDHASTAARMGLMACAVLVLLPFGTGVRLWADVWTAGFGIGLGLLGAWTATVACPAAADARTSRRHACGGAGCAAVGMVLALVGAVALRYGSGTVAVNGPVRNGLGVLVPALYLTCASVLARHLAPPHTAEQGEGLRAGLSLTACAAVLCGALGRTPWLGGLVLAGICTAVALGCVAATRERIEDPGANTSPTRPYQYQPVRLPWLAASAFCAWTWGEVWRATNYTSLLPVLGCGTCALLVVAGRYVGLWRRERLFDAIALVGAALVVWLIAGGSYALVVFGLLMACFEATHEADGAPKGTAHPTATAPWHHPLCAASAGIVAGTLATNAYGTALLQPFAGMVVPVLAYAALGVTLVLVVAACVHEPVRCGSEPLAPSPSDERRIEGFLTYKGLSSPQAHIVRRLAEGATVRETAAELNYAESTVRLARHQAYDKLGVQTREQLISILKRSLEL